MRDIKSSFVTNFYLKISKTNFLANFFFFRFLPLLLSNAASFVPLKFV